ncbi:MAG: type II secretion system protein GspC [Pseudomonadota bacterium]
MILKRFFPIIILALISLVVWLTADIFLTVISPSLDVPPRTKTANRLKKPVKVVKHPFDHYSIIASKDIFNPSDKANDRGPVREGSGILGKREERRSITKLNLELKGIVIGDTKNSFAIIEDMDENKQDLYRLNDTIKGATLVKILDDRVILTRNGQEETLIMTYKEGRPARKPGQGKPPKPVQRITSTRYILNRESVNNIVGDLNEFMTQLSLKPYYESGQPAGFQISEIKRESLVSKMGLIKGDIIKSINNVTIESPEQAMEVYELLRNESSLTMEIERGGRKKTYNYEIK